MGLFRTIYSYSNAVTIDLEFELFGKIIEDEINSVSSLVIQGLEMQKWEKIRKKIIALEAVFGLLNELSPEEMGTFEGSVKRRPLFK